MISKVFKFFFFGLGSGNLFRNSFQVQPENNLQSLISLTNYVNSFCTQSLIQNEKQEWKLPWSLAGKLKNLRHVPTAHAIPRRRIYWISDTANFLHLTHESKKKTFHAILFSEKDTFSLSSERNYFPVKVLSWKVFFCLDSLNIKVESWINQWLHWR